MDMSIVFDPCRNGTPECLVSWDGSPVVSTREVMPNVQMGFDEDERPVGVLVQDVDGYGITGLGGPILGFLQTGKLDLGLKKDDRGDVEG
jgi:hypothetical protein